MSSLEEQILRYGQLGETESLTKFVSRQEAAELIELVRTRISQSNFPSIWNYLLQGFDDSRVSHEKRFQIVREVVKYLEGDDIQTGQATELVRLLARELIKFKTEHLTELVNIFMTNLQANKLSQLSWQDLLPEILRVLRDKNKIPLDDNYVSEPEFRGHLIDRMCSMQWSSDIVTTLTIIFINMALSKDEHRKICTTLTKHIDKMSPQEIPPFTFQMLKLCKSHTSHLLFHKLQNYFTCEVYDQVKIQESETPDLMDDDTEEQTNQDAIEAESTVLLHVRSAASSGQECIKDYANFLKNLTKTPEYTLNPFNLCVLLEISSVEFHEDIFCDIVRPSISRLFNERQNRIKSKWLNEVVETGVNLEETFAKIIQLSVQERHILLKGLVNLSFLLLGVGAGLGRDIIAEKQWHLGAFILFKIIKRQRHLAPAIISRIAKQITICHSVTQYVECLYRLSKDVTLLMIENKSSVVVLIETLPQIPANNAKQLLEALVPLTKVSPTLRDVFIVMLQKSLFSRSAETREMVVIGFLKLISTLEISNVSAVTQSTYAGSFNSGHSFLTQMSLNRSSQVQPSKFSREAICLECLSILGKCFKQQTNVKMALYKGLYDVVCSNKELAVPILDMLWSHFVAFYEADEETLPPIKLQQICLTKDTNVILEEPLAYLIFAMGSITCTLSHDTEEHDKYRNILDSLCTRMINCELLHFQLDDGTDLFDVLPESQEKMIVLKEVMLIYEALIGYKIYAWKKQPDQAQEVHDLFEALNRVIHFSKNISKPKKGEARKRKADGSQPTQANASTVNNTTVKKTVKSKQFKAPQTILDFPIVIKCLNLLHEPAVTWTTATQANILKTKQEFHKYIMQSTINLITDLKHLKLIDRDISKTYYGYLCSISTILYERIIQRFDDFLNFDTNTACLALETFLLSFNLICNKFKSNLKSFLSRVSGIEKTEPLTTLLNNFIQIFLQLFERDYDDISTDPETKKMQLDIINILASFINQIPVESNTLSTNIVEWLKHFALNKTIPNKLVAPVFASLLFEVNIKFKISLTLFENVSLKIGEICDFINEEEENEIEDFKFVSEGTVNCILNSMYSGIKAILDDLEFVIARLKCEAVIIGLPNESTETKKESLRKKEQHVCCQLCCITAVLTNLCNCAVPTGHLTDLIIRSLTLFYTSVSNLTKYFISRSSKDNPTFQSCRFERLVKLCGKELAPTMYRFISYLESSQKTEKKNSESSKNKMIKDTKLLPKLIYEIELFRKSVMQLSKKSNVDLTKFVGHGTTRDFRLTNLDEVMGRKENVQTQETETTVDEDEPETVEVSDGE